MALNDFRPGASDIDFVAVTEKSADPEAVRSTRLEVARRHRRPHFNGLYVAGPGRRPEVGATGPVRLQQRRAADRKPIGRDPGGAGVSRLHNTLATGKITSKAGADEALRVRRGEPGPSRYRSRWTRRRATLSFLDQAITVAHNVS